MRIPTPSPVWLTVICLTLLPTTVLAQSAITGQVDDATGLGLPAVVEAVGFSAWHDGEGEGEGGGGGVTTITVTAEAYGRYRLDVPAGEYAVRFSLPGYGTVVQKGVRVEDGGRVRLDVRLSPVALTEGVTVFGVHPYAASRSMADRLAVIRRDSPAARENRSETTPLVERAPRMNDGRQALEWQLFWKHVEDGCLGYLPMRLGHVDVMRTWWRCPVS